MFLGSDFPCNDERTTSNPLWQCYYNSQSACVAEEESCTSHATHKCYDNDVYWYDACNNREEKFEECGESENLGTSCSNGHLYQNLHNLYCEASMCSSSTSSSLIQLNSPQCASCNSAVDVDCNNCVSYSEIISYANKWIQHQVSYTDMISSASQWISRDKAKC